MYWPKLREESLFTHELNWCLRQHHGHTHRQLMVMGRDRGTEQYNQTQTATTQSQWVPQESTGDHLQNTTEELRE